MTARIRTAPAALYSSRITAYPTTASAQAVRPCSTRPRISASMEPALAQRAEEEAKPTMPSNNTGRRPMRSDKGPQSNCARA